MRKYIPTYYDWLVEAEVEQEVKDLLHSGSVNLEQYVKLISQPDEKVVSLIKQEENKDPNDIVKFTPGVVNVNTLLPTQNVIYLANSLANGILSPDASLPNYYAPTTKLGDPIITWNNKYIIDGHHRWSQTYCWNPSNGKMDTMDLAWTNNKLTVPQVLAAVQSALAIKSVDNKTSLPSAGAAGSGAVINLYQCSEKEFTDGIMGIWNGDIIGERNKKAKFLVKQNYATNDEVQKAVIAFIGEKSKNQVTDINSLIKWLWNNLLTLRKSSPVPPEATKREVMPQTGEKQVAGWEDVLKKGMVDVTPPFKQ